MRPSPAAEPLFWKFVRAAMSRSPKVAVLFWEPSPARESTVALCSCPYARVANAAWSSRTTSSWSSPMGVLVRS